MSIINRASIKIVIRSIIIISLAMFLLCACNEVKAEEKEIEIVTENTSSDITESSEVLIDDKQMSMTPEETLEYLFNYLYPDKENKTEIILYDEDDALYYKFKNVFSTGEISDPWVLYYIGTTDDGIHYRFGLYGEVWESGYGEDGKGRKHIRNYHSNYWYVNIENGEVIPWKIYVTDSESGESYYTDNEKYLEIE